MSDLPVEESKVSTAEQADIRSYLEAEGAEGLFDGWLPAHDAEIVRVRDERIAAALAVPGPHQYAGGAVYAMRVRAALSGGVPDGE